MTLEESIQAALDPCASTGGGAFQDVAEQNTLTPYIVWQQIVSTTNNSLDGASNIQNTRIQVDVYSKMPSERKTVADAVRAAMAAASFSNINLTSQNTFEPDTKLFRTMLEFSVWG